MRVDGRLVSYVWIMQRSILINGSPVRAAGIRGLMTHPARRRRGFGRTAMLRATEFIWQELQPDLALLFSSVMAVPFYRGLGWEAIYGPVLCEQPDGSISYTEVIPMRQRWCCYHPGVSCQRELSTCLACRGEPQIVKPVSLCGSTCSWTTTTPCSTISRSKVPSSHACASRAQAASARPLAQVGMGGSCPAGHREAIDRLLGEPLVEVKEQPRHHLTHLRNRTVKRAGS